MGACLSYNCLGVRLMGLLYFPCGIWRFLFKNVFNSTAYESVDSTKTAKPLTLAASGAASNYRQILHGKYDNSLI